MFFAARVLQVRHSSSILGPINPPAHPQATNLATLDFVLSFGIASLPFLSLGSLGDRSPCPRAFCALGAGADVPEVSSFKVTFVLFDIRYLLSLSVSIL